MFNISKKIIISLTIILSIVSVNFFLPAQASPKSIINNNATDYYSGNYELDDFVILAVRISRWILGIVGSLALIMFIYGGLMFLISGGSANKIAQAKKIIVAAVVGLVIVLSSYLIIKFVMRSMGVNWTGSGSEQPIIISNTTPSTTP